MTGQQVIDTVAKSCAYADFDKLRAFVESDPTCVNLPDDQGYLPLQASLAACDVGYKLDIS